MGITQAIIDNLQLSVDTQQSLPYLDHVDVRRPALARGVEHADKRQVSLDETLVYDHRPGMRPRDHIRLKFDALRLDALRRQMAQA